ncbi:lipoprotein [Ochrobactrum sp. CM-21-5]|nr:lipoprotein [Ochrobactrum sp. CM-21-5]MBC2883822.1 lipoprotein [Ochrobactrum sp. CM-21-5]
MTGRSAISSVLLIAVLGVALAACGRKGPLEPPPSAIVTDEQGHTKPKPKEDKPFILDKLL